MGTVGTTANVGAGVSVALGGMKVGITLVLSKVEVAVGDDGIGVTGGIVGMIVTNPDSTCSTGTNAACVGTNGVGVGDSAPHATNSQPHNIRRENGRFRTMQIKTKLY